MIFDTLVTEYPELWHMADARNVEGILERGLLSTARLAETYRLNTAAKNSLETSHRRDTVTIKCGGLPPCYIRDQKPMSVSRIEATLQDATVEEFFRFINSHAFFWPNESRLGRMNAASPYRDKPQLVFVLDSRGLLSSYESVALLSPINSGCTTPYAHKRSIGMFKSIADFDWSARRVRRSDRVAEILIPGGVPDLWGYVKRLEIWQRGTRTRTLPKPYDDSLVMRLFPRGIS